MHATKRYFVFDPLKLTINRKDESLALSNVAMYNLKNQVVTTGSGWLKKSDVVLIAAHSYLSAN